MKLTSSSSKTAPFDMARGSGPCTNFVEPSANTVSWPVRSPNSIFPWQGTRYRSRPSRAHSCSTKEDFPQPVGPRINKVRPATPPIQSNNLLTWSSWNS